MMIGQLPIVSYYRDADKEVFQAASQHIEETPPALHWLDCRELARKYLPDLPEFKLSTVLKTLDLYSEYGDSDSVEQTTQIVVELARLHKATSVEELWGELYDQPDKLLGLGAGLDGVNFIADPIPDSEQRSKEEQSAPDHLDTREQQGEATPAHAVDGMDEPNETLTSESEAEITDSATVESWPDDETAPKVATSNLDGSEVLAREQEAPVEEYDQQDSRAHETIEDVTVDAEVQDVTPELPASFAPLVEEDHEPQDFVADQEPPNPGLEDGPEQPLAPEELGEVPNDTASDADVADDQPIAGTTTEDVAIEDQLEEYSQLKAAHGETTDALELSEASVAPTTDLPEVAQAEEQPVGLAETSTTVPQTAPTAKQSRTLRTLGFIGLFGFGILTIVGIVLTIMAVMLFFTDNALLLETKIAGVVLTTAVSLLGLLMTTISYQSFRKY